MLRSLGLGVVVGMVLLVACVTDEPTNLGPHLDVPPSEAGAEASSGASGDGGQPISCSSDLTLCGDTCVDVRASNAHHCGRCDRACGLSICSAGVCPPYETAKGFTKIYALSAAPNGVVISADRAVSLCAEPNGCTPDKLVTFVADTFVEPHRAIATDTAVYFDVKAGEYYLLKSCPLAGCPNDGGKEVEKIPSLPVGGMALGPKQVAWIRSDTPNDRVQARVLPDGVPTTLRPSASGGDELAKPLELLSLGEKSFLWGTGGLGSSINKQLRYCLIGDACTTPNDIDTGTTTLSALAYFDAHHYFVIVGDGASTIFSSEDANPRTVLPIVRDIERISAVAVDASGLYWANATTGKILRCANLQDCSRPEELASDQKDAKFLTVGPKFVYWALSDRVMQVAK